MTVALLLAARPDAGLPGQLAALGVRQVDAAEQAGPGLLTVAAAARAVGERVLICVGDDSVPEEVLTRLLAAGGTAAFTGLARAPRAARERAAAARSSWTPRTWTRSRAPPNRSRPAARSRPRWARCSTSSPDAGSASASSTPDRTATARSRG